MAKRICLKAREADIAHLDSLYEGRTLYFGDLHNHAATGGRSDGKSSLENWKGGLQALEMDFVAILDHRQVRHMYLPEWVDGTFICGTEPGTRILDCEAIDGKNEIHYNMIVPEPKVLEEILTEFEGYEFEGGPEGFFKYLRFTREEMGELIDALLAKGGFFVHPHPKQYLQSNDPLDYWFRDKTGLEVFYYDMRSDYTEKNYELWCDLLALDKKIFACAGEDGHKFARSTALTAIYSVEKSSAGYLTHLRAGDFVCGSVAMRMCIGDTTMGGECSFAGKKLCVSVDKFHVSVRNPEHKYEMVLIDDKGIVAKREILCDEPAYFAFKVDDAAKFYRVEIFDITQDLRIAIGNPIWNKK